VTAGATAAGPAALPDATPGPLLAVEDLHVRFHTGGRVVHAVTGLSWSVEAGRTIAVIGESGSGKTASSRAVMGLLPPTAQVTGSIRLQGQELVGLPPARMRQHRGRDLAMIFQDPARSLNPIMRVGPQIAEAIRSHERISRKQARRRVVDLLGTVRLSAPEQRYDEYPHQLSGGMRQRVMIAMALACRPRLLIADEATTALDVTTQAQVMNMLMDLQRELGMAVVVISHDLGLAASYADQVVVMYAGRAVERAPRRELFHHVRMPYTQALLSAVPRIDGASHSLLPIVPGRPPDLSRPLEGCPFAPRCPRAGERCVREAPPFETTDHDHAYACWHPCADGEGQ